MSGTRFWELRTWKRELCHVQYSDPSWKYIALDIFRIFTEKYFFDFLKVFPDIRHKVDGLIEIGRAQGVVLDELDVVVLGQVALAVITDSINYSDPEVFYCSKEVLVANEITPNSTAVGTFNLLGQMIYKDFK